jgi:hypothetical protein
MNPSSAQTIAAQHRRSQIAGIARGIFLLVLALILPIALTGWIDAAFVLGPGWRWLVFVVAAGATFVTMVAASNRLRRANPRATAAAMDAGSLLPSGYVISTSAEFATATSLDPIQQSLLDRLHAEAGKLAATSQPRHPWPGKWLVLAAFASAALAISLVLIHGTRPILRMVMPWQSMPYTRVTLAPAASLPAKNEPFTITGSIHGRIPANARIVLANGQSRRAPVSANGSFELSFPEGIDAPTTATAYASADGISPTIPLDLRSIPTLVGYQHTITPPAYTRQPVRHETHPSFALPRASRVHFSVTFDSPPSGVSMIFDNANAPLDLTPSPESPRAWVADLGEIARTFGYQLEIRDARGTYSVEENAQQIVVIPDRPPTIAISESNADQITSGNDILRVAYAARDDIGLAEIAVRFYRIGGTQQQPVPLAAFDDIALDHNGEWLLPLAEMHARPLDTLVVIFQARDINTLDGPGIAYSEPLIVEIPEEKGTGGETPTSSEGEGQAGGDITQINPLELQREIYRDTLRTSLRHSDASLDELAERQREIPKHLAEMAGSDLANALGAEFVAYLVTAADATGKSADALGSATRPDLQGSLSHQATAINALVEAARLQTAMETEPGEPQEGESAPKTQYTLVGPNTPPPAGDDAENQQRLAQALLDLQQALEQQQNLNQEMRPGEPSAPAQGAQSQGQTSSTGGSQGTGNPEGGSNSQQSAGESQQTASPSTPAQRQLELANFSSEIEARIEKLRASGSAADPQLAADQMRRAAEFQRQAADALLQGDSTEANREATQSENAILRALIITESLLGGGVKAGIEANPLPTGYQGIIQNYSRRLSYDQ